VKKVKTKVYIIKKKLAESNQDVVLRTLKCASLKDIINKLDLSILINPNWVMEEHSDEGNITSTDSIEGLIIYLIKEAKISPDKIIIGDGGQSGSAKKALIINDVFRLEEYGVRIMNLNEDKRIDNLKIVNPLALKKVNIAKTAMDASSIISIPSLKTHSMAVTTLSMKNIMGTILPKGIMHSHIHKKIADLVSLVRKKMKFQIIDGIIGSNGSEIGGSPVRMNIIIAGEDPVAVDTIGSAIIGYGPEKAKYLTYAEQKGLGTTDLSKIEIIGSQIEEVYKKF